MSVEARHEAPAGAACKQHFCTVRRDGGKAVEALAIGQALGRAAVEITQEYFPIIILDNAHKDIVLAVGRWIRRPIPCLRQMCVGSVPCRRV